ncbi:hypothetical protein HPB47_022115 [Ixodes persulcatus]|uniref:Uncharacterized protein n=1 Tax=Ixodes persulcatus TaxID=34615 RepID=A0AC60QBL7_IXOPE|nr:hypothetical protein HPB47_022115 [Ixodes persulcatus]
MTVKCMGFGPKENKDKFFIYTVVSGVKGYLYFVKVAGPRWMKNREPFEITNIVRFYNLCMVAVNARFLYIVLKNTYLPGGRYSLWCQGITGYMDEELTEYYKNGWFFVAVRYVDLLDTVFCVLRKKFRQITHLHVIHHVIVATNVWFWTLFAPEGQVALGLAINVFVHVIMYSYYFLATLGPGVQKYLWWKKYLTTLQITQFAEPRQDKGDNGQLIPSQGNRLDEPRICEEVGTSACKGMRPRILSLTIDQSGYLTAKLAAHK